MLVSDLSRQSWLSFAQVSVRNRYVCFAIGEMGSFFYATNLLTCHIVHSPAPLCLAPSNRGIADWWRDSLRELLWVGRMLKNAPLLVVLFMLGFCSVCYSAYLLGLDANRSAILSMLISVVCYGGITVYVSH